MRGRYADSMGAAHAETMTPPTSTSSTDHRRRKLELILATASAMVNTAFAVWFLVGILSASERSRSGWSAGFGMSFLGFAISMAVCSILAVVGAFRRWNGAAVTLLMTYSLLWSGLLGIGALCMIFDVAA